MRYFELVNMGSGNIVGFYETEEQALAAVAAVHERQGGDADALPSLGLALVEDNKVTLLAEDDELLERARAGIALA